MDSEEQHDAEADEKSRILQQERLHLPELLAVIRLGGAVHLR